MIILSGGLGLRRLKCIGQQLFSVPTEQLIKGSYLIEVDNGQQKSTARFIVQ